MSPASLIKTKKNFPSTKTVESKTSNLPYWIVDPRKLCEGIRIDPEKRTATLARGASECYTDNKMSNKEGNSKESGDVTI
ncbi:hypothetical protein NPX13_g8768 [Xylaria arbuscula]|uniref:Uncharacterized protein n=1 Tax=Xylaria arbuscula TaxID=114810 RepID=A0A9W8N7Z1_9PEZI|nr:hypothetical protein NPX13_g8768 [Xylaria arbuscula]